MRFCVMEGDPSTKLIRSFASGTAQDDSSDALHPVRLWKALSKINV